MSVEENKAIVRRLIEEMDRGNWDSFEELCSPDYLAHYPGSPTPLTREEQKEAAKASYAGFPDFHHTIHDVIAEDDKVVFRTTDRATHKGEFQGIAPTGRGVEFGVIGIFRIAGGKIAETWLEADLLGLMQQLGAIPAPGQG